jgi:hypothetical protein
VKRVNAMMRGELGYDFRWRAEMWRRSGWLLVLGTCSCLSARKAIPPVCITDAGAALSQDGGTNDPRCPPDWSGISSNGYQNVCSVDGLVCAYPEGQAECAADGQVLKWSANGVQASCGEFPPQIGSACCGPGKACGYITGPVNGLNGGSGWITNYCCNGITYSWEALTTYCPNGNTCGPIKASDYDQSCTQDSDCVGVFEGDLCRSGCVNCANAAIRASAQDQYHQDLTNKDPGSGGVCPCPLGPGVGCVNGFCRAG